MKYDKAQLFIGSADLSEFVRAVEVIESPKADVAGADIPWPGLTPIGSFIITGRWDDRLRFTCPVCKLEFTPEEHVPQPHVSINDGPSIPCCAACAVQYLT